MGDKTNRIDKIWDCILLFKKYIGNNKRIKNGTLYYDFLKNSIVENNIETPIIEGFSVDLNQYNLNRFFNTDDYLFFYGEFNTSEIKDFLKFYLPYSLLSLLAYQNKQAIVVAHFAQTLDGKIATLNGNSKWIGNKENLIHAHRMRALCDGIMIGNGTFKADQPRLDVRLVCGENPLKIRLGAKDIQQMEQNNATIWVDPQAKEQAIANCFVAGKLDCVPFLKEMYLQNLNTIYLEGGPKTSSTFLSQNGIAILQLHIAPIILGSGKNAYELDEVVDIKDGIKFKNYQFFPIGDEMMFVGI
jgi:diaminohydroxyphosphoribosylaminopyrimidine deaminase/5-amino-6-(5-phosphoribosylamino)uracil reductase